MESRRARLTAEVTAPRPTAPMKMPTRCAPSWKVLTAIAGISVVYGLMEMLTAARAKSMRRVGRNPMA